MTTKALGALAVLADRDILAHYVHSDRATLSDCEPVYRLRASHFRSARDRLFSR